jgi:hypothetical protein
LPGAHLDKLMFAHGVAHINAFLVWGSSTPETMIDVGQP